jgi:hypothetical protein
MSGRKLPGPLDDSFALDRGASGPRAEPLTELVYALRPASRDLDFEQRPAAD